MLTQLGKTLAVFQLIEEWLKIYITQSYQRIKQSLPPECIFRFSEQEYDDAPLGSLLKTFRKLNDNEMLQKDLAALKAERDYVAHKAAVHHEIFKVQGLSTEMDELLNRLLELEQRALAIFHVLEAEIEKISNDGNVRG